MPSTWVPVAGESAAVWFVGPRRVELRQSPYALTEAEQVLVATELSGISAGTELLVYRGLVPPGLEPDLPTVAGNFGFPVKFGYACVGRVEAVGPGGDGSLIGRRVFALHPHQGRFVAPAHLVVPIPADLDPERAVFFANLETAFNVLLDAHPRLGERVVVFGQGVVGLLVTRLASLAGVDLLVAVDPLSARRAAAERFGADLVLHPDQAEPAVLRGLAGHGGFDLAVEASGVASALQTALEAVAFQGTVVACAWYGARPLELQLGARFHRERVRVMSSQVSHLDPALSPRWDRARRTSTVLKFLQRFELEQLITHRIPVESAATAYQILDERPSDTLQMVLTYESSDEAQGGRMA